MVKTGIFGGAFDPVHNGHVHLAREAVLQLKLRRLIIVPTFDSPNKKANLTDLDVRMEMCREAFKNVGKDVSWGECGVEISPVERELGGTSFTINTLRELKKRISGAEFYLIIGGDMMFSFKNWYKYESILKECTVCAAARGGDNYAEMLEFAAEIGRMRVLPTDVVDLSSTEIRNKIAAGEDISGLVPKETEEIIREKGLYLKK